MARKKISDCSFNRRLPELLRRARMEAKISIRELARRSGLDPTYLSRVERAHVPNPTWPTIIAIARELPATSALSKELETLGATMLRDAVQQSVKYCLDVLQVSLELDLLQREDVGDGSWRDAVLTDLEKCVAIVNSRSKKRW